VPRVVEWLRRIPLLDDVSTSYTQSGLAAYVQIDRVTAARFGITPATIDNALYDAFGQRIVSTIFTQSNQYRVILEADPGLQQSLESLGSIYLPSSTAKNGQVPLSAIARVVEQSAPLSIGHLGQFPAALISFNLAPGAALGDAVDAIREAQRELGMPPSMVAKFQGAALAFEAALRNEVLLILAERNGGPIAGALNLIGGDTLYGRYWGCVEDVPFLHFELCYYQAIDAAIARGLSTVEAGAQGEHKLARGYVPVPTWSAHYIPDRNFRRAIADFLARERAGVESDQQYLAQLTPFRRGEPCS